MFGSFGSTPAAAPAPASTSLFGQTQPAQGQAQGQTPAGSSLFGTQQPAATGGGMFGQPAQQQQQQQQQSTGLFGSTTQQPQQQQQSTGLFGSTTNQQSSTTGGGLFGSSQQPQQQQPSTGGIFGSTTQTQPQQGGLFGSTNQQGGGMFGSTTTNNNNNQQQGSLFGNAQQQQSGQFGSTNNNNNLGSSTQPQQSNLWQSTIGGGTQELDIEARMMKVKNSWDPASAEYKFKVGPSFRQMKYWLICRRSCILSLTRGLHISMEDKGLMMHYGKWLVERILILPRTSTCPSSRDDDHDADRSGEYP
jgi:hypothetical protein